MDTVNSSCIFICPKFITSCLIGQIKGDYKKANPKSLNELCVLILSICSLVGSNSLHIPDLVALAKG